MRNLAVHPTVAIVLGGPALYPLVRERPEPSVLRLSPEQVDRALRAERARSDAPETAGSQGAALSLALEEEALAEHAITEGLHRRDDTLRRALAAAARAHLAPPEAAPPTDAELHAMLGEAPLEDLVDAELVASRDPREPRDAGVAATDRREGVTLAALEADLGVAHLPMPTRDAPTSTALTLGGGPRTLTLRVHPETEAQRMARARPELERLFRARSAAAAERAAVDALVRAYDRVERP